MYSVLPVSLCVKIFNLKYNLICTLMVFFFKFKYGSQNGKVRITNQSTQQVYDPILVV